ncbi:acyltransferase domain-containing protein, partial [Frankia sp. Cppng1_Ct_nod]|uniref:acyltransferase domain-containing protein n=1 Tax=Frankia sp. Cppng1_Ct_nod TaxID=2897162 RepID=UPI00202455B2
MDVGWSLAACRSVFEYRAVVLGDGLEELRSGLAAVAGGVPAAGVVTAGRAGTPAVGVMFSGQGSQRVGMGAGLYSLPGVFRRVVDEVCGLVDGLVGGSLREVMFTGPVERVDSTRWAQPALFVFELALWRQLEAWGVRAEVVMGHSVGELVAAHVAGVWSLEDAVRLVVARGELMDEVTEAGAMVAVAASESDVAGLLPEGVEIAAVNGPSAVVISGRVDAVESVVVDCDRRGWRSRRLAVGQAFHSVLMDRAAERFRRVVAGVPAQHPSIPVVSTLTGRFATGDELADPDYWAAQLRRTVRFADGVQTMAGRGTDLAVEVGPDATLASAVSDITGQLSGIGLQRRGRDEVRALLTGLATLFVHGAPIAWNTVLPPGTPVDLPTYAFQHDRYWL